MAINLTPEEKTAGEKNFRHAAGQIAQDPSNPTRRRFLQGALAAGAAIPLTAAAYYGYTNSAFTDHPIKVGLIGAGDEGGVLVGEHNPKYLEFVAYSDIRPYNQNRIFTGEPTGPRRGFNYHYGSDARSHIRLYESYKELLANPDIEAVVIALPLNMHARVAIDAMNAGKHVMCEKLMGWDITQCKAMIAAADAKDRVLSIGHQRHYSLLYAHANDIVRSGVLGDIRYISAQWHRNYALRDGWQPEIRDVDRARLGAAGVLDGYQGFWDANEHWPSVEQLVRWRLYRKTGGGLMAELGSHQLDACSIFLGHQRPLAVTGVGGKDFYTQARWDPSKPDPREIEDHVYCTYEFRGPQFDLDLWKRGARDAQGNCVHNDVVTVTYSSISTNSFQPYGECVMGSKGTLITELEQRAMLFGDGPRSTLVSVSASAGKAAMSTSGSAPPDDRRAQEVQASVGPLPSRGYREELEHFAFVIRNRQRDPQWKDHLNRDDSGRDPQFEVHCDGRAAMADAIMALTANIAMRDRKRVDFQDEWFDPANSRTPEGDHPWHTPTA